MLRFQFSAIVFLVTAISLSAQSEGQPPPYQWFMLGVTGRISSKWSVAFSRQYSRLGEQGALFDYYLDDFKLRRRFGDHWEVSAGLSYLVSNPDSEEPTTKRRYSFGLRWQTRLLGDLRFYHRLIAERHLQERRYDGRIIGTMGLEYAGLDLFKTINIRPFIVGQLYYFLGGAWIKQYDSKDEFVRKSPTYGLHRARLRLGLSVSPCSWFQLSGFYLLQKEFNNRHALLYHHQINEINPATGKITRPFDNYRAWGVGLTFLIGSKKKSKQKSEVSASDME